jgi:ketosteroid isomerase-like protein
MNQSLWRTTLLAGLLVNGLLACTRTPAASESRIALEAAIQRWTTAVNAQDAATLNATMTDDVVLSDDTATLTGRDAVIRALRDVVARGKLVATTREITLSDDAARHVVALTRTQKNGDVQALGQALELWKRVNGEWKLHRRTVTGASPSEELLTRPSTKEPVLDRPGE